MGSYKLLHIYFRGVEGANGTKALGLTPYIIILIRNKFSYKFTLQSPGEMRVHLDLFGLPHFETQLFST